MPGNEVGDTVHNFFAQDNLSQGQHLSQAVDGNWSVLNNSPWVGSQRPIGVPGSSLKNYNLQQSDTGGEHNSHTLHVTHGLNIAQSALRTEFPKSLSQSQQQNLNGYVYGHQVYQTRQDETNLLGVDPDSDQHSLTSRGLAIFDSNQGSGPESYTKTPVRSETSESPVSFDFFSGQHQMSGQQSGMLQHLQRQQSGFSDVQRRQSGFGDVQRLQQQIMIRKMQELQRQQQLRPLDTRQQNSENQIASFAKQAPANHSMSFVNGTSFSDASPYPWATDLAAGNTNWVQQSSLAMQGPSNGLAFSPDQGQVPRMMGLVSQQVDQSLYGFPISGSRGNLNQQTVMAADKPSMQQMPTYSYSLPGNQHAVYPDQVSLQDGNLISRQGFQGKALFGHDSSQSLNNFMNIDNLQQRNEPLQEFPGRQGLASPSETIPEKAGVHGNLPQDTVALDPTEEKILFGSDDNIWDAFGRGGNMSAGPSNVLDNTGFLNGFPSVHSGTWSALMQSAVAETSGSEMGLQEEWNALSFQNSELPTGSVQPLTFDDSGKQQKILADGDPCIASTLNSGSAPFSAETNSNNNCRSVPAFQQFGHKFSADPSETLQTNSSQGVQQTSRGNKWLNQAPLRKSFVEGTLLYGHSSLSLGEDTSLRHVSGSLGPQQSDLCQPCDEKSCWIASESIAHGGVGELKFHEYDKSLQHSQSDDQSRADQHSGGIWKPNSVPSSNVELEPVGSSQVKIGGFSLNDATALPNSSTARAAEESSQLHPNSNHLQHWRQIGSSGNSKGGEALGKLQNHPNMGPQVLESSLNGSDKGEVKTQEMENRKQNSNDSHHANKSHYSAGGLRENIRSDVFNTQSFPGTKQKSSGQVPKKIPRKFQYHPMGNLDEDLAPSNGTRQASHSQELSQLSSRGSKSNDLGYFGQSNFFSHAPKTSTEMGKEHLLEVQQDTKGFDEGSSRGTVAGHVPDASTSFNKASQSSQNMLELLQKVDQSRESGMQFSSSECNPPSEMPEAENSDGSVSHLQRNQPTASRGFGLQLAPPSQRMSLMNHASSSQGSMQIANSFSLINIPNEMKDKHESSLGELKRGGIIGQTGGEATWYNRPNFHPTFSSGLTSSGNQLQNQQTTGMSGQVTKTQSAHFSPQSKHTDDFNSQASTGKTAEASLLDAGGRVVDDKPASAGDWSHPANTSHPHERVSMPLISVGEPTPVSQPVTVSGTTHLGGSPKSLPDMWTRVSAQQRPLNNHARSVLSRFSQSPQTSVVESTLSAPERVEDENARKGGNAPDSGRQFMESQDFADREVQPRRYDPSQQILSRNIDLAPEMNSSQGKGPNANHLPHASASKPSVTQRDIEAFGRSLRPNNFFHQNYALLNQIHAMNAKGTDSNIPGLKRMKGSENDMGGQQESPNSGQTNERNSMAVDALNHGAAVVSGEPKMLSFSGSADNLDKNASSQIGLASSQDLLRFGSQSLSRIGNAAPVGVDHSRISPQMAPSWFEQFGTFKNGQILPMYDARRTATIKTDEQPFNLGKSAASLYTLNSMEQAQAAANQSGIVKQSSISSVGITEHLPSAQILPPEASDQRLVVVRPKKRKSATSDLVPWHKELSQCSRSLSTISMAEVDWAKAANRLTEKIQDEVEMIEDISPIFRTKRRLILTTQLMQQLFRPPPASILFANASSNCDSVPFLVARLALQDACYLASSSGSESHVPQDSAFLSDDYKASVRIDEDRFSKVMEDVTGRARKLENDFLSLDMRTSIVDLRVECQDIEKCSVINRFAKFHGRGQADGADTSSSSNVVPNLQKPCPQRYVTALPVPRNLPDRVQCLSL